MNRQFPFILLGVFLLAAGAHAQSLEVHLDGVRDNKGYIRVGIYENAKTFLKESQALAVKTISANAGAVIVRFDDLPAGRYAIMAYHDENADGRLNRRFGMFPTEGYGLSNNPKVIGPPRFGDSVFEWTGQEKVLQIEMRY